jgi:predicted small secreted protein
MKNKFLLLVIILGICQPLIAQDNLMDMLNEDDEKEVYYVPSAFKGTHVINGHSTKTKNKRELDFLIYHRFGPINSGIQEFFGLDQANMRLGFEYGLTDQFNIGIGRSTYNKTYDGYVKWKFVRQKTGAENFPVSMVFLSSIDIPTIRIQEELTTFQRMGFTNELLISRKFGPHLTFQLIPGMVRLNTVPETRDDNNIFYLGGAFRYKLNKSLALTGEYYYRFNPLRSVQTYDAIALGVDIQTGGHVFQLHITNSRSTFERGFITDTIDDFWDGDIRFGFNISRTFQTGKGK